MDRQIDNNTVFVSATQPILYAGCDFRLYWAAAGLCFMAAVCLFAILPIPASLYAMGFDALLFFVARWYLQQLAKSDPLAMQVYLRHIRWPAWLPAQGKMLKTRARMKVLQRT
jgi:type IV secretory pathway TrbD component